MKKAIDFDDLFNRVSGNREFALRMLQTFFGDWHKRMNTLHTLLHDRQFDELSDSAHQMKGILGNLAVTRAHTLLKTIHTSARQKDAAKTARLLKSLEKEITAAEKYLADNQDMFN